MNSMKSSNKYCGHPSADSDVILSSDILVAHVENNPLQQLFWNSSDTQKRTRHVILKRSTLIKESTSSGLLL